MSKVLDLPHLPDMLFTKNGLSLQHNSLGFGIRFDPIDALKFVNSKEDLVHVAKSKEWLEARSDHADINKISKPYDWTFTPTNYMGSIFKANGVLTVTVSDEKIDYERLKVQEAILFYEDLILYEDELDDNGVKFNMIFEFSLNVYFVIYLFPGIETIHKSKSYAIWNFHTPKIFLTCRPHLDQIS